MVHIYYHIYAIDEVIPIIDEQLSLIDSTIKLDYELNIGISVDSKYKHLRKITKKVNNIRDMQIDADEFVTLDLIEKDKINFGNSDYILYFHTKGASRQHQTEYNPNIISWRNMMNYFNIIKYENALSILSTKEYNTYGVLLCGDFYQGNFWWASGEYIKSIDISQYKRKDRYDAEGNYIRFGKNWKPYCAYNIDPSVSNLYNINFKKETYIE